MVLLLLKQLLLHLLLFDLFLQNKVNIHLLVCTRGIGSAPPTILLLLFIHTNLESLSGPDGLPSSLPPLSKELAHFTFI